MRTDFSKRAFWSSAPTVWNSLTQTVLISDSLTVNVDFKLFCSIRLLLNTDPPAPLKLRPYGAIEIQLLLLLKLCSSNCQRVSFFGTGPTWNIMNNKPVKQKQKVVKSACINIFAAK